MYDDSAPFPILMTRLHNSSLNLILGNILVFFFVLIEFFML